MMAAATPTGEGGKKVMQAEATVADDPASMMGARTQASSRRSARFMEKKGCVSQRTSRAHQRELEENAAERALLESKRGSARQSAMNTARASAANPLPSSRPRPARWNKRADDWKHESTAAIKDTQDLWEDVAANAAQLYIAFQQQQQRAGRPPSAQHQEAPSLHKLGQQGVMSDKERSYQLERQLEQREKRLMAALRAQAKEDIAVQQHAEKTAGLEYYNRMMRQRKPLEKGERKAVQQRLYSASAKRDARVYG
jgi:hypothetical protein